MGFLQAGVRTSFHYVNLGMYGIGW